MENKFKLPELGYGYDDLAPFLSAEQLQIHHDKHHKKYVDDANMLLESMEEKRVDGSEVDVKKSSKELSFNIGGHILHSLFWSNLAPVGEEEISSLSIYQALENEFGSFDSFKKEFSNAAITCEGSGWAVLTYSVAVAKPIILQVEKHNLYLVPGYTPLMVLDVWEHAYYLDYKNDRKSYIERFWDFINWSVVDERFNRTIEE